MNKSLKVTTGLKAGKLSSNGSRQLKVTTGLKGGRLAANHSRVLARA
jgi:hypothetical protein